MAGRGQCLARRRYQHPYPTLSELVRWTADQVGKASRSAAEQALGVPVAVPAMLSALTIAGAYIGHARILRSVRRLRLLNMESWRGKTYEQAGS